MQFRFRCNATYPTQTDVEAHFDVPGARPIVLRVPKPGPAVGDVYDFDVNGNGVPASVVAPQPSPDLTALQTQLAAAVAERDAARTELNQVRTLLSSGAQAPTA